MPMFLTKCVQQFETFKIQFHNKIVLDTMTTLCATICDTTPKALFWVISVGDQERPSRHLETTRRFIKRDLYNQKSIVEPTHFTD